MLGLKVKVRETNQPKTYTIDIMTPKKVTHRRKTNVGIGIWETRSRQAGWNTKGTGVTKSWSDSDGEATPPDKTQNCPTNTS